MITFTCDRCKKDAPKLWEAELVFTEVKIGEQPDGQFSDVNQTVCESCSDELEALLARERSAPDQKAAADAEIAAIVSDYVRWKREAVRLRHERVITYCFRAEPNNGQGHVDNELNWVTPSQEAPCWKGRDYGGEDPALIVKPENWCEACKYRQQLHEMYRTATKQRGIAERRLMRRFGKVDLEPLPPRPVLVPEPAPALALAGALAVAPAPGVDYSIDDDIPF